MYKDESLFRAKIDEMIRVYRDVAPHCINQKQAVSRVVNHEASCFFILPHAAYNVIRKLFYGKAHQIEIKQPRIRKMYIEIYRRVVKYSADPLYKDYTLRMLCEKVVKEPAPEFYISETTFRYHLSQQRKIIRNQLRYEVRR